MTPLEQAAFEATQQRREDRARELAVLACAKDWDAVRQAVGTPRVVVVAAEQRLHAAVAAMTGGQR